MSIQVDFYNFYKDDNSTARPGASQLSASLACEIRQPCSIMSPRIITDIAKPASVIDGAFYNYCYIADFQRFYFVSNWNFVDGFWSADLAVDKLGTYREEIGSTPLFILRSSAARNGYIKDTYYPLTGQTSRAFTQLVGNPVSFASGYYVVNIAGKNTGTSTLYQMSPAAFSSFLDALLGVIDNFSFSDVIQAIKNTMFDPLRYITSVLWFPQPFDTSGASTVKVGLWDSGVNANIISNPEKVLIYGGVALPKHPQAARGAYLNAAPFTNYALTFDPFGTIELDSSKLVDTASISVRVYIDALTGAGILTVKSEAVDGERLATIHTQYGVPLPLLQSSVGSGSISGSIMTIGSAVASAVTGNAGLMAEAVASGCGTMADAIKGTVSTIGSGGNIAGLGLLKGLQATFYYVTDADNARNGSPLMQVRTPASLGGFMIAQRGDVAISGTATEADELRGILERGFYYE